MTAFCDLPHDVRFGLREAIEAAGGMITGYFAETVQVALPRNPSARVKVFDIPGLAYVPGSMHYFPRGSDAPPDALRHDGNYPGSRGFWQYASFRAV